jgi:uncharacterized protein involved in response to NO
MPPSPSFAASRTRTDAGWLFAAPFRPFFVGASALAALSVPAWVAMYVGGAAEVAGMPAFAWHAHEMVFGFLPAVMAGYLLSATPNWSGRLPASGRPLAALFVLWAAGRVVPFFVPLPFAVLTEAAFPLAVTAVLVREARTKSPRQSRHGLILFPLLAVAAVVHRLTADDYELAATMSRVGIAVAALLISAVGGRLVPSLTRNSLAGRGSERVPEPYGRYDVAVLVVMLPALVVWILAPASLPAAVAMAVAATLQALRLWRWRGWLVRQFDVLALHAGYLWLVIGTALAALAATPAAPVPPDAALHAFTTGAIGAMTMAVMARLAVVRASRSPATGVLCMLAILGVNLGALARVLAPVAGAHSLDLIVAAAALWAMAWTVFTGAQILSARP